MTDEGYAEYIITREYADRYEKKINECSKGKHEYSEWKRWDEDCYERHCANCLDRDSEIRENPYLDAHRDAKKTCARCDYKIKDHMLLNYFAGEGKAFKCPNGKNDDGYREMTFENNRWGYVRAMKFKEVGAE